MEAGIDFDGLLVVGGICYWFDRNFKIIGNCCGMSIVDVHRCVYKSFTQLTDNKLFHLQTGQGL